jgi:hypothetical protein
MRAGMRGMPAHRVALTSMLCALVVMASGCGSQDSPEGAARPPAAIEPVHTLSPGPAFAPLVRLPARERWLPIDPNRFVAASTLRWHAARCPGRTIAVGRAIARSGRAGTPVIVASKLGGGVGDGSDARPPYRHRPLARGCRRPGRTAYATSEHTRPHDPRLRPRGLPTTDGYVLDLADAARSGSARVVRRGGRTLLSDVPIELEAKTLKWRGRTAYRMTYWLLYGMTVPIKSEDGAGLAREGDWERVSVLLLDGEREDTFVPVSVRYELWGRDVVVPWRRVERVGGAGDGAPGRTHPVVYAAVGSHSVYPSPGVRDLVVRRAGRQVVARDIVPACVECPIWRTWRAGRLVHVESWFGYGGAWGEAGETSDTSGPLGPSPSTARE